MRQGVNIPTALMLVLLCAAGCNTNPPKRIAFESVPNLAFIHPGQTMLPEILFRLGTPAQSIPLPHGSIVTYRLGPDMSNVGLEYLGYGEHKEPSVDRVWLLATYSLVIQFNGQDKVETVNLIKVRSWPQDTNGT